MPQRPIGTLEDPNARAFDTGLDRMTDRFYELMSSADARQTPGEKRAWTYGKIGDVPLPAETKAGKTRAALRDAIMSKLSGEKGK